MIREAGETHLERRPAPRPGALGADAPAVGLGDGARDGEAEAAPLAEIVDNLLRNAVKYTPAGGRVTVELAHGAADGVADGSRGDAAPAGEAVLRVRDTGIGFAPEEADHLFDRFYRSDDAAVQAETGSGLGLAVARAIAEAYGGSVRAESAGPGQGATFEVRLPFLTNHA
jgi:signal transduction histidine kinase